MRTTTTRAGTLQASLALHEPAGTNECALEPVPLRTPRLMACLSPDAFEPRLITDCARLAVRLRTKWYAVYVAESAPRLSHSERHPTDVLSQNLRLAAGLGGTVVRLRPESADRALPAFARREGITHVMIGEGSESRWTALWAAATLNAEQPRTAVLVFPDVDTPDALLREEVAIESPHAANVAVPTGPSVRRLVCWGLALLAVGVLFVPHVPALVCFAGAATLAVFWCRELASDSDQIPEDRDRRRPAMVKMRASETR
jgi:K+-sensing histidine kinase KdpD